MGCCLDCVLASTSKHIIYMWMLCCEYTFIAHRSVDKTIHTSYEYFFRSNLVSNVFLFSVYRRMYEYIGIFALTKSDYVRVCAFDEYSWSIISTKNKLFSFESHGISIYLPSWRVCWGRKRSFSCKVLIMTKSMESQSKFRYSVVLIESCESTKNNA